MRFFPAARRVIRYQSSNGARASRRFAPNSRIIRWLMTFKRYVLILRTVCQVERRRSRDAARVWRYHQRRSSREGRVALRPYKSEKDCLAQQEEQFDSYVC